MRQEQGVLGVGGRGRAAALLAVLGMAVACGAPRATAELRGGNLQPPVDTDATGTVTATLDGDTLEVEGRFERLSGTLAPVGSPASSVHVHQGAAGTNGAVVFGLDVEADTDQRGGSFRGGKELTEAEREAFQEGMLYVDVHSARFTSGELRGQLEP